MIFFLFTAVTYKIGNGANIFLGSGSSRVFLNHLEPSKNKPCIYTPSDYGSLIFSYSLSFTVVE